MFSNAIEIIENGSFLLKNEIIAEIVYVLEKVYKVPKVKINKVLTDFFASSSVIISDKRLIFESLKTYEKYNLDFVDSILLAYKKIRKYEVITFDNKLNKLLIRNWIIVNCWKQKSNCKSCQKDKLPILTDVYHSETCVDGGQFIS